MEFEGKVAPQVLADGVVSIVRTDKTGAIVTAPGQGKYYEATARGTVFSAANQAAVTSGVGLRTDSVNFTLYNPAGSGVNLSILDITIGINAAPAAASVIYLTQNNNPSQAAPTSATSLTVVSNALGLASAAGKAYSTATLAAAPTVMRILASVPAASNNTAMVIKDEVAGAVVVTPGTYVSIQTTTAIGLFCAMSWQEVKI